MTKYLYGAAVQGIQGFIFQTNELKDIVGASELVEEICTDTCNDLIGKSKVLTRAAGKIRCEFDNEDDCMALVRVFPKVASEKAPGITISQAVIKYDSDYSKASQKLEDALKVQRNKPMSSLQIGLMGIKRSPQTGLSVVYDTGGLDDATKKKKDASVDARQSLKDDLFKEVEDWKRPKSDNIGKLVGDNDWIAMVHIDGNGLGKVFESLGYEPTKCKEFSENLNTATKTAASQAVKELDNKQAQLDDNRKGYGKIIPILPVVLSGDDFTFICRASIAIDFIEIYLRKFEEETDRICKHKLTACGGVTFMKSSYPYYYAYNLAEELCGDAKKMSNREHSCLMFHKVQDSFVENFKDIEERELTPQEGLSFKCGPYYVEELQGKQTIKNLLKRVADFDCKEGNAIKSHIRQWMSELLNDKGAAEQKARRVSSLLSGDLRKTFDEITLWKDKDAKVFPAYDLLSLASVKYQVTKSDEEDKK